MDDKDLEGLFERLSRSAFRSKFRLNFDDRLYARLKGREVLKEHAHKLLENRIGQAYPLNDGKQTPVKGHPVFTAQHATGTCCRSCLLKWHHIEKGRELTAEELDWLTEVILEWIRRDLEKPEPRRRLKKGESGFLF